MIRVLEIRAADNGYVITAFEHEYKPEYLGSVVYKTYVAESPQDVAANIVKILRLEHLEPAVYIPPARGSLKNG